MTRALKMALVALFALVCMACGTKRLQPIPLGYTICADAESGIKPVSFIRLDVLASEESVPILAHETDHQLTIRRFKSCANGNVPMMDMVWWALALGLLCLGADFVLKERK